LYSDTDLQKILNVSVLNQKGIKISKIAAFSENELNEKILSLCSENNDKCAYMEQFTLAMIHLDEELFRKNFSDCVEKYGFDESLTGIIYPFLQKTGFLWQTGHIHPAQEHFISNLIRSKIITETESLQVTSSEKNKTFLLFLHEKELHETGLLYYHYVLKKNAYQVIYLGQNVPLNDLINAGRIKNIDYLFTSFTKHLDDKSLKEYLDKLSEMFVSKTIFITGPQIEKPEISLPENIRQVTCPDEIIKILQ
jgi:methanogenic corrinoid protein MtbC1